DGEGDRVVQVEPRAVAAEPGQLRQRDGPRQAEVVGRLLVGGPEVAERPGPGRVLRLLHEQLGGGAGGGGPGEEEGRPRAGGGGGWVGWRTWGASGAPAPRGRWRARRRPRRCRPIIPRRRRPSRKNAPRAKRVRKK